MGQREGGVGEGCSTTPPHIWDGKTPLPGRDSTFSIYAGKFQYVVFMGGSEVNFMDDATKATLSAKLQTA